MMKKLFSLVLVVCMLVSAMVFAEAAADAQNDQPPKVAAQVNAAGEAVFAKICDQDGNVLAEIKDAGMLELTEISLREKTGNAAAAARLCQAYAEIMEQIHYSDVECGLHEDMLKADINEILAGMGSEMNAYDLIMSELFDIALKEEAAALLTEGGYIEVVIEMSEGKGLPLISAFTADGLKWQIVSCEAMSGNSFKVKLPAAGTLALMADGYGLMGIGKANEVETVIPGDVGIDEENDNFMPSVSGKPAPGVVVTESTGEERYVGYLRNKDLSVNVPVPDRNYVVITPVSERAQAADIQTREHLEWAYNSILETEDLGDLPLEQADGAEAAQLPAVIAGHLDETIGKLGLVLTRDQLIVKDLFSIDAYGDYVEYLYDPQVYLEIVLNAVINPGQQVIVMYSADSSSWNVMPVENYAVNADGMLTLKMHEMGAVALLVPAQTQVNMETAVQAPN